MREDDEPAYPCDSKSMLDRKPYTDRKPFMDTKPDVKPSFDRKPYIKREDDDDDLERIKPISLLHEMCAKKAMKEPKWTLTQCSTNSCGSIPVFTYEVEVAELNLKATGTANKKKTAKHTAAQNMLLLITTKIDEKTLAKKIAKPSIISETFFENFVGSLQRLCGINRWKTPHYTVPKQTGPPHCRAFICSCTVFIKHPGGKIDEIKSEGIGISMKLSKQEAAKNMRKILIEKEPDCEDPERDLTKEENEFKKESVKPELVPFTKPADVEEYDENEDFANQNSSNNNYLVQGEWETTEAYEERKRQHESFRQTDEPSNVKSESIKTELVRFTQPADAEEYDEEEDAANHNYSNNNFQAPRSFEQTDESNKTSNVKKEPVKAELVRFTQPADAEEYDEDEDLANQNYLNNNSSNTQNYNVETPESLETEDRRRAQEYLEQIESLNNIEMNTEEEIFPLNETNNVRIKTEKIITNNDNDYNDNTPEYVNQNNTVNIKVERDDPESDDDYCEIITEHILPDDHEMEVDGTISMDQNNSNIQQDLQKKLQVKIENIPIKKEHVIVNLNDDNLIETESTNCVKKISEFHYSMLTNYGVDMRDDILDKIRKMIMRIVASGKIQEPNFIDYQIIYLDEIMSAIGVDVNHNVFVGYDGSYIMVINATTIPEIIETEIGKDKSGFGTNAFFKVVERIKSLLK
ncbi:hypothetical protein HCN44_006778 [Aphidius gifuensis]|uniref:DRBM domain-containing protein n=1 Tax=Aphidius gifuensis TaxID=684658 RepID=A0A834Y365_APHGI|nr:protein dopey homolog PFC0245c-like [Aphidius gifuensis]KAF7995671.1 hypothetical protein HCN44_006778 [Aphidius gifuensis]